MKSRATAAHPPIGVLLKNWRRSRHWSQLDLAHECGLSARHLGFIEIGKARPSREAVRRIAAALSLSLRERNTLLLAAGFAPIYSEQDLAAPALDRMRQALDLILQHQNPYPAFVLNRHFDVLAANDSAARINGFLMCGKASRHTNLLRQIFDPEDFRPIIANWREVAAGFLRRLHEHIAAAPGDDEAKSLLEELLAFPDVPPEWRFPATGVEADPVLTLDFHSPAGPLRFFETITRFAAPLDVTLDELCIDCAFPVDDKTAEFCAKLAA